MHHEIDALAYTNRLRALPPEQKLGFAIALFTLAYLAPQPVQLLIAGWMALWIVGYAGIPMGVYGKLQAIPLAFWLASVPPLVLGGVGLARAPEIQADVWQGISLGNLYLYLSLQGITQVTDILTRTLALTACLYFVLLTVPFVEILRVLKALGCPALITDLLSLMYRFIAVLAQTVSELLTAQQSRGGYRTWRLSLRSLSLLVSQLLLRTLENYRQVSLGLISRGFTGDLRVLYSRRYRPQPRYTLEALGGFTLLLLLTGWHYVDGI